MTEGASSRPPSDNQSSPSQLTGPSAEVLEIADEAVDKLGVKDFISSYLDTMIGPKLEDCEDSAFSAPVDTDMMFMALSLPIVNGIIHIASNQSNLSKAQAWVMQKWQGPHRDPDAISLLSALTLIYVVDQGWKHFKQLPDKDRAGKWGRMRKRTRKLGEEMEA